MLLSGCHRHSEGGQFNIREFPVKEGIDTSNAAPTQMIFFSYSDGIMAVLTGMPNNTFFYRTKDEGITWKRISRINGWFCRSLISQGGCIYAVMEYYQDQPWRSKIMVSKDLHLL